jgi:integrase
MTPRRRRLTDEQVRKLKVKAKRYTLPDPELVGHYVRVMPTGAKSFVAVARSPFQKKNEKGVLVHEQVWITLAPTDHLKIEVAREKAREAIARVKRGQPAIEPPPPAPDTFKAVADNWFKRHVEAKGLRTRHEIERCLSKYVLPTWRDRVFDEIRRSDVALLLDHIEDAHGSRQADATLTIVRSIMNWYASRSDDYVVPVARGMKRSTNGARQRILNDDEIRLIWKHAEQGGAFGSLVQLALLTGQRLEKLLTMRWSEISAEGAWTVPSGDREKGTGGTLMLPEPALAILRRQPRVLAADLVFPPARGNGQMSASVGKNKLDDALPPLPRWTVHDCRRTARSLMSRTGVRPDIAERVLGHTIKGIGGVYDRHAYTDEKRIALEKLAALIQEIVVGAPAKVIPMSKTARS